MAKGTFNRQIVIAVLLAAFILFSALCFAEPHSSDCIAHCNQVPDCKQACVNKGWAWGHCRDDGWCCCTAHR
ncbi:hypothetical protein MRB53_021401 [Persea americana]|uniref:Uncharacterized protein n=1 Tax=Persea americana TaxID=3435 RepID=A0ACC2L4W2_PERAE|nr:hypothetical protein MRB53_021401 [Persea americana]